MFLNFSQQGSFDDLERIFVDEVKAMGAGSFDRYYVWVEGERGIKLLPESTTIQANACRVAEELHLLLDIPVAGATNH